MLQKDFVIVSDGACDLPLDIIEKYNIKVVPFYISYDGKKYQKEIQEISVRDVYQTMHNDSSISPKTALPSINDYEQVFNDILGQNLDIICVCVSTKFSGSFNSALSAKEKCLENYPNARIEVINSMIITGLQGIFVVELARMRKDGKSIDQIIKVSDKLKKTGRIFFTVGNLEYLRKGGRIGKLAGMVGATLKVKPIIVLKDGELFSEGLSLSRKKSFLKATSKALEYFEETRNNKDDYQFVTGYGLDEEEGKLYNDKFKQILGRNDVLLIQIGATIGVHTGPYPLGVGFIKKYEKIIDEKD